MSPALSYSELSALEDEILHALATGDDSRVKVAGYGEITTVVEWTADDRPVACKRLPGLADEAAFNAYRSCVECYIDRLSANGIRVPETVVQAVIGSDGSYTAYCVQPLLSGPSILPRFVTGCSHDESAEVFESVVDRIDASITDRAGLDGQLSNWAFADGQLWYFDISTPFLRDEQGREMFDVELHIASVPWALRGLVRMFFLDTILDKYYTARGTLLDLLGNMIKERLDGLLPAFIDIANRVASPAFTIEEVTRYYRRDARLWAFLQALRRADRAWQIRVRRRTYPFLLPKDLPR
jgi:hypothetical protein